ncbi:MAG: sodium:proton antiporter [Neomegalonema sp.]|nr:sodium:proton antiporter [Neomegalonema sp.]
MDAATFLYLSAAVFTLAAVFGYLNTRFLKLPMTIGLLIIAFAVSVSVMLIDQLTGTGAAQSARNWFSQINFHDSLMIGMLSFLLFAGAMHTNLETLLEKRWHVLLMATLGVIASTAVIGLLSYALLGALGFEIPLIWCFVFGSLISPTDPVAVLSILKTVNVPKSLQTKIAGESLFNDGVGVVVFLALLSIAAGGDGHGAGEGAEHGAQAVSAGSIAMLFIKEVLVGVVLGLAGGSIAFMAMRSIDEYVLEVIITLALVLSVYAIAVALHASGPLAVVIAGLMIGNTGTRYAMSQKTREHVVMFWELMDEILNAALFLLIGFEVLLIGFGADVILAAILAIPLALIGRVVAVVLPTTLIKLGGGQMTEGATPVLIWGGLRGGISVALALALPTGDERDLILAMTYAVVVFSIIVQGLTVQRVIKQFIRQDAPEA